MIKIIIFTLSLPLIAFAQKEILTHDQINDIEFVKQYENNTSIDSYITKDGLTISIGDTLTIGNAVIERKRYMFHDVFSHIVVGKTKGTSNKEYVHLSHNYSGSKVIVNSLFVTHKKYTGYKLFPKRNEMPLYVSVFLGSPKKGLSKMLGSSRKTILDIDKAFSSGEIIDHNTLLSRDQKVNELEGLEEINVKKDDEKYNLLLKLGKLKELGLLTEEEFEKEKKKILNN